MNIDIKDKIKINTNYNFKLVRNEEVVQEINTHNLFCNAFFRNSSTSGYHYLMSNLYLQLGKGSTEPTPADTKLTSQIWSLFSKVSYETEYHLRENDSDEEWCQAIYKFIVPATESYVSSIAECGLFSQSGRMLTHALILDAEGSPIVIEKTDLDRLEIEIRLRFYLAPSTDTIIVPRIHHSALYSLLTSAVGGSYSYEYSKYTLYGKISNNLEFLWSVAPMKYDCDAYLGSDYTMNLVNSNNICSTVANRSDNLSESTSRQPRQIKPPTQRLLSSVLPSGQHYIKGIRLGNTFTIPFPNHDIFAPYTISDISVGIGDGETAEFVCPLNYFMKDTDKVYIDGVLQTRGVDYTLEHDNNNQGLSELMAGNDAIITGGLKPNSNFYLPMFRSHKTYIHNYADPALPSEAVTSIDYSSPVYIDMLKETKVNTFYFGNATSYADNFTLYCSDDGIEYVPLLQKVGTNIKYTFETVIKRYFKLESKYYINALDITSREPLKPYLSSNLSMLGYIGHGIQFTNPPISGAVITMEAQTDLPMINENFVFDAEFTLDY